MQLHLLHFEIGKHLTSVLAFCELKNKRRSQGEGIQRRLVLINENFVHLTRLEPEHF